MKTEVINVFQFFKHFPFKRAPITVVKLSEFQTVLFGCLQEWFSSYVPLNDVLVLYKGT